MAKSHAVQAHATVMFGNMSLSVHHGSGAKKDLLHLWAAIPSQEQLIRADCYLVSSSLVQVFMGAQLDVFCV